MTKLDEYFDRARRETPPLQKDEVSNILREKLSERPVRETAHTRGNGVWWRSIGRIFLTLPLKGWIMISALLTSTILATAFFWQATPQRSYNGVSASQAPTQAVTQAATPTSVSQTKLALKNQTEPNYTAKTQTPTKPKALTTINAPTLKDSLPAPYDFVPVDEPPYIDIASLKQKVVYPEEAKKLGIEGKVNVRVLILPDGKVSPRTFVEISDARMLDSAALRAVFAATWTAAKQGGKTIPCWVSIPIVFRNPERNGTKRVNNAQMLRLTDEELKKIGVEQSADGTLKTFGWNHAQEFLCQTNFRMHSKPNEVLPIQLRWFEVNDSVELSKVSNIVPIIFTSADKKERKEELRRQTRQFALPLLIADGHGKEYFRDMSAYFAPMVQRMRAVQNEANELYEKMNRPEIRQRLDSVRQSQNQTKPANEKTLSAEDIARVEEKIKHDKEIEVQRHKEYLRSKFDISKLIGIRIPSKQARAEGDEYLLWYDPTPEFIALLPERYRTGLEREVAAAKKYATKCEIPTEEERKAIPGYFDSWRSCDGVLKIASIFPNPADVKATVRFTLAEARSVTITVHNLNGDRLAILEPTPVLPAGEHELPLDFTGRNVGVYLLALSTDKNETAIKRVIISR